ncbi:MAG TPA: ABC transporter ATP-binding protein [Anaerolineaceae bacterium]|jgi:branched-chain amino acid transport system ATP-binding protein|nr:ABC transporter ATP-binding protein [Anaerolineaceae bacterium]
MLTVKNLNVYYGVIQALRGISFYLNQGEIVALIGANGAGKSTTLKTISGIMHPREGSIEFNGENITVKPAQDIVKLGIVHVPEGRKIFARMTVLENLYMGAFTVNDKVQIIRDIQAMFERFPRLAERKNQLGGTLSGGEQQMLTIARGLMSHPKLLLLDEPSMGLAPLLVEQIFEIIQTINEQGTSILLVEQNAQMALAVSNRAYVIETGTITIEGNGDDLLKNDSVVKAYLGA